MITEKEYINALETIKKYQDQRNCESLGLNYTMGQIRSISNRIRDGKSFEEVKEEFSNISRAEYNEILWRLACDISIKYEKVLITKFLQDIFNNGDNTKKQYVVGRYVNAIHYYLKPYTTPDILLSFDKLLEAKYIRGLSYHNLKRIQDAMKNKKLLEAK